MGNLSCSSYTPFTEDKPTNTQRILFSLANTFIFMGFVITATIILILLYKFKCYKVQLLLKEFSLTMTFFPVDHSRLANPHHPDVTLLLSLLVLQVRSRWKDSNVERPSPFASIICSSISVALNRPIDMITISFLTWNIGVVGMFCIHWKGPLRVQQAYLILMSALLALVFYKFLPDWTGWLILGVISIWGKTLEKAPSTTSSTPLNVFAL